MAFYANDVHPIPPDHAADDCDDQLPLISRVGRGLKGDSYKVKVHDNGADDTRLEGLVYDEASKTYKTEWISENINGGKLMYQYNLRPYTIPRTFTITFIYRRHDRQEWSWTTPAIPYIWTLDDAGKPEEFPDHIVGSGVATLFIKTMHDAQWNERLKYPDGTTRDDFNAPLPNEAWAATITFGKGGDIEVPDFDDIAKVIGITKEQLFQILEGNKITINGISVDNLLDYIIKADKRDLDHIHADLGFNSTGHGATGAFGGFDTVKAYIDDKLGKAQAHINNLYALIDDLVAHIYGASVSTVSSSIPVTTIPDNQGKKITWPANDSDGNATKIPMGSINVYSGEDTTTSPAIRTHSGSSVNNDLKGK